MAQTKATRCATTASKRGRQPGNNSTKSKVAARDTAAQHALYEDTLTLIAEASRRAE